MNPFAAFLIAIGLLALAAAPVAIICWPDPILKALTGFWRSFFPPPLRVIAPLPPEPPKVRYPQWRINFTDRYVEVESAVANSAATFATKFTSEQARQFAHNLTVLADSLDKATKAEEAK